MSWSISLSGGKKQVLRELEDASALIERALYTLQMEHNNEDILVNVSCSGSAYSNPDGTGAGGASFNVGTRLPPPPPAPPQEDVVEDTNAVADPTV